eukprot:21656_1
MGAYFSALIAQITAKESNDKSILKPINESDENILKQHSTKLNNKNEESISDSNNDLNYNSPSPSESSLSLISKHDTEDEIKEEKHNINDNNNQQNLYSIQEEEINNEFINNGLLHYEKIRKQWTQYNDNENENNNNTKIWEPLILDDDEMEQLYRSIADEKPFKYNVPLEVITEIVSKIWKHEQMMGYEISSKHAGNHALALDRL